MNETDEKPKDLNLKKSNDNQILIEGLKSSAKAQNKATNDRIDKLDGTMVALVGEIKILVETSIRREESEIRNTERSNRFEKTLIDVVEKIYFVEKQVLLLKSDYDNSKKEKEKNEKNRDTRKNTIISGLTIAFVLALFALIAPYV